MVNIKEENIMELTIMELLEKMKTDETWCDDPAKRNMLVSRMIYFILDN